MLSHDKNNIIFLIWLILIEGCWILGTKVSEMLLDYIKELTFSEIQIAEALFSYTIALTIFIWGYLVDRYNNKRKLILGLASILWIIASFILFFAEINFQLYCIIQILWGLSFGANGPLLASYLGDIFKIENRGKLFSTFTIFVYIIKGSNIAINGIIGRSLSDWKAPTFIFAIVGIIIVIIFILFIKEPKLAMNEPEFLNMPDFIYNYHLRLNDVKIVVKKRTNFLFLIQGIFGMVGVVVVTRYMSYWFTSNQYDGMGMNIFMAIILLGAGGALGGFLGIVLVGRWIDSQFKKGRINRIVLFAIICIFAQTALYAVLILFIRYPTSINGSITQIDVIFTKYPVFIYFIIIFNFCVFCGTPIGTTVGVARTHINLPEHRGTAGALYDLTDFIGAGIGLLIGNILIILFSSYKLTIVFGASFWLISGFIWLMIYRSIGKDYKSVRDVLNLRSIKKI
ncbi:MAG: MFS transporter [Promethearchaeota archaeon]